MSDDSEAFELVLEQLNTDRHVVFSDIKIDRESEKIAGGGVAISSQSVVGEVEFANGHIEFELEYRDGELVERLWEALR